MRKCLIGALALLPAAASADDVLWSEYGVSASFGGGLVGFVDSDARDFVTDGGAWEARMAFNTRGYLTIEAAYIGSLQNVDALGLDNNARLLGSGAEGDARFNFIKEGPWQPYGLIGIGWTRYDITNSNTNTSDISDYDNVMTIPMGLGVGYRYNNVLFDLRGTYRGTTKTELINAPDGNNPRLDTWSATLKAGFEF